MSAVTSEPAAVEAHLACGHMCPDCHGQLTHKPFPVESGQPFVTVAVLARLPVCSTCQAAGQGGSWWLRLFKRRPRTLPPISGQMTPPCMHPLALKCTQQPHILHGPWRMLLPARVRAYSAHRPTPCLLAGRPRHTMVSRTRAGQQMGSRVTRVVRLVKEPQPLPLSLLLPMCQGQALTRV